MLRHLIFVLSIFLFTSVNAADNWADIEKKAKGQSVYFNAWGGSSDINAYIDWVKETVATEYGITLVHVLLDDTAVAVSRILTEQENAKNSGGSVDLIWINGENFRTLKLNNALTHNVNSALPFYSLVNTTNLPTEVDFTIAVDNLEVPWGVAQLVFVRDSQYVAEAPKNARELLRYAQSNPGRFSYPRPPQFHGSSFLKQVLIELVENDTALRDEVEKHDFATITAPLWDYLDALHPVSWRKGKAFPKDASHLLQLLNDGELDIAFTFNPQEVATAKRKGNLPQSASQFTFDIGSLTNVHFVAIPANSENKEAAMVVANFLISPDAQSRKASTQYWGDPSVLDMNLLDDSARATFDSEYQLYPGVSEPHPSWQVAVEEEWAKRYGN